MESNRASNIIAHLSDLHLVMLGVGQWTTNDMRVDDESWERQVIHLLKSIIIHLTNQIMNVT